MIITTDKIQIDKFQWFYRQANPQNDPESDRTFQRTPVLFLHGLPAHSHTWQKLMTLLAEEEIPSIAPDWLGCGFSDKPSTKDFDYTPEAYITALGKLIASLKLEQFYLVVQGFLGSVGIQYALQNPEQIAGLIILNSPITTSAKLPWKMQQMTLPLVGDMITQDPLLVDRTIEKGSGFVVADEDLDILRKPFLQSSAVGRALMTILKKLQLKQTTSEIETGLRNWTTPTLIIWGTADSWLDLTEVQQLVAANEHISLVELPEAKHYPQEHWGSEISAEIIQFFRRKVF